MDEGLLASLLLALQQLPSLLTSAPRTESVSKVREGLSQVGGTLPRHCLIPHDLFPPLFSDSCACIIGRNSRDSS